MALYAASGGRVASNLPSLMNRLGYRNGDLALEVSVDPTILVAAGLVCQVMSLSMVHSAYMRAGSMPGVPRRSSLRMAFYPSPPSS